MYGQNNGKGPVKVSEVIYSYEGDPAWADAILKGLRYHYLINAAYVPVLALDGTLTNTIVLWSTEYNGSGGNVIPRRDMAMLEAFCVGVVYVQSTAAPAKQELSNVD